MIDPRPMEEKIASLTKEAVNENGRDYIIYRYGNLPLFKIDVTTYDSFPLTVAEKNRGIRLCLEARLKKNIWMGDILHFRCDFL
jgi:hypothetical protein